MSVYKTGFPGGSDGKESACNAGHVGLIPESGRSPGEGMVTHSSILAWRIPIGRGAWWVTVHGDPEIPPSSRDEGLRLLHGLETNLATSLQTPQEA